jgi:hypothetical protein
MWKLARAYCRTCGHEYVAMCDTFGYAAISCSDCQKKGVQSQIYYQESPPGVDLSALVMDDETMKALVGDVDIVENVGGTPGGCCVDPVAEEMVMAEKYGNVVDDVEKEEQVKKELNNISDPEIEK